MRAKLLLYCPKKREFESRWMEALNGWMEALDGRNGSVVLVGGTYTLISVSHCNTSQSRVCKSSSVRTHGYSGVFLYVFLYFSSTFDLNLWFKQ